MQIDYDKIKDPYERNSLRTLELYFTFIFDRMVSYRFCYDNKMIVKTDKNESYIYNTSMNSIRRLPDSSNMDKGTFSKEFGRRVEYVLWQRRMSQNDLAEALDMDPAQLSRYLNGKTTVPFYVVDKIARVLDCSVDELRHLD